MSKKKLTKVFCLREITQEEKEMVQELFNIQITFLKEALKMIDLYSIQELSITEMLKAILKNNSKTS